MVSTEALLEHLNRTLAVEDIFVHSEADAILTEISGMEPPVIMYTEGMVFKV